MNTLIGNILASLVSAGIYWLHNRNTPKFSREEIRYLRFSFSQFGEDIGLTRWFDGFRLDKGVYLDVGAFHPIYYSNTLLLRKKGWRGVNVDLNADKIAVFNAMRPDDVNVCAAVSSATSGNARSSGSGLVEQLVLDSTGDIPVRGLDDILAETPFRAIDYLNIDCEGHDYDVLQSIDLDVYRPKVITIEAWGADDLSRLSEYLTPRGYALKDRFHFTLLFVLNEKRD